MVSEVLDVAVDLRASSQSVTEPERLHTGKPRSADYASSLSATLSIYQQTVRFSLGVHRCLSEAEHGDSLASTAAV